MPYVYSFLALLAAILVLSIPYLISERLIRKKVNKVFAGRESLRAEEFHEKYFASQGIPLYVVLGVKKVLERELNADFSRASSEDDLLTNLNFFYQHDSLADVNIVLGLEEEFGIELPDSALANMTSASIDEIVSLVWSQLSNVRATTC